MNQFKCDQCHRTHTRSKKCIYCGAGTKYQKPVTPTPAPRVRIVATQLELPIPSPADHDQQVDAMHEMDTWQAIAQEPTP
jgi:hypothetical protein